MSTRLYSVRPAEGYDWLNCIDAEDYEVLRLAVCGDARWREVSVKRVHPLEGETALPADFPWLGSYALVMSSAARESLAGLLANQGSFRSLDCCGSENLSLFETRVVDALDTEQSTIKLIPGTTRVMKIVAPVFDPDAIEGMDLFRVEPCRASGMYASERFLECVSSSGLTGLCFEPLDV